MARSTRARPGARVTLQARGTRPAGGANRLIVALAAAVIVLAAVGIWAWQGSANSTLAPAAWNVLGNPSAPVTVEEWGDFQ